MRLLKYYIKYNFDSNKYPAWLRVAEWLEGKLELALDYLHYYDIKRFVKNIPFAMRVAWKFRPWDYSFNVELFADSLIETARVLHKHGNAVNSEKYSRRAYAMAGYLKTAYELNDKQQPDKALHYYYSKGYYSTLFRSFGSEEARAKVDKLKPLVDFALDRESKMEKARKEEAWKYVHKYIEHLWD
jgi:hypothetical protein